MVFEREAKDTQAIGSEAIKIVSANTRRIRALEQRFDVLEMRIGAIEQKIIDEIEELKKSFDQINTDIKNLSQSLSLVRNEILRMNKSLDKTAKKAEVKELESLLELYNPIKSKFVTREEVERLIDEKLTEKT
jgi:predicted  nucleic acid-binding Zn-ribbon protein